MNRNKNIVRNTSAQLTVVGLMLIFLTLMVLGNLMPTIIDTTNTMATNLTTGGYTSEAVIVQLIPLFLIVVFLSTIALYGSPQLGS